MKQSSLDRSMSFTLGPHQGSQFVYHKTTGYLQVKKVILQFLKSQEYKTWKKLSQYNNEILYILTFQVLSKFSAKFLVLSRFSHFLE